MHLSAKCMRDLIGISSLTSILTVDEPTVGLFGFGCRACTTINAHASSRESQPSPSASVGCTTGRKLPLSVTAVSDPNCQKLQPRTRALARALVAPCRTTAATSPALTATAWLARSCLTTYANRKQVLNGTRWHSEVLRMHSERFRTRSTQHASVTALSVVTGTHRKHSRPSL